MILGERVRLRAIERDDLPRFVRWLNDPEVRQGLELFLPMSQTEEERWYERVLNLPPEEHPLAIDALLGEEWVHIGSCGLGRTNRRSHSAELGIAIGDKAFWDQGYGTDTMKLLLEHAFDGLNLHRVHLRVFESNKRAIKVYRRVGFKDEGRLREDHFAKGRYWDTLIMGLLGADWRAQREGKTDG